MTAASSPLPNRSGRPRPRHSQSRCSCRRRAGIRDGRGRRHHPAHRKRPLDHPMEPGQRRASTADPGRLAARVRSLPPDPAISAGRRARGNDPRRVQVHLLLGMGPPAARPDHRAGLFRRLAWFAVRREIPKGYAWRLAACSSSAGCRARSAGSWSCRGSKAAPRSAPIASPRTCCSPCSSSRALIWTALDLRRAKGARPARLTGWGAARPCRPRCPVVARRLGGRLPRRLCLQHVARHERPFRP